MSKVGRLDLLKTGQFKSLTDGEKQEIVEKAARSYGQFLTDLGFDWQNDDHMRDTPHRVAKAWVNDLISGCFTDPPTISQFVNDGYNGMVIQKDVKIASMCAHHNLPFFGKCTIAYLPKSDGKVVGLSKLNRIAQYFAQRPSVQEILTKQIHDFVSQQIENNRGVAVVIESTHCCVSCRGVRDENSEMVTSQLSGYFFDNSVGTRTEFFSLIK